jgi:hypothetical protein
MGVSLTIKGNDVPYYLFSFAPMTSSYPHGVANLVVDTDVLHVARRGENPTGLRGGKTLNQIRIASICIDTISKIPGVRSIELRKVVMRSR